MYGFGLDLGVLASLRGKVVLGVFIKNINNEVEMTELALIENLQRSDLNPIEEATAYCELKENYNMNN